MVYTRDETYASIISRQASFCHTGLEVPQPPHTIESQVQGPAQLIRGRCSLFFLEIKYRASPRTSLLRFLRRRQLFLEL